MRIRISILICLTALALSGCAGASQPTPLPTLAPLAPAPSSGSAASPGGTVTASGELVPVEQAQLAFAAPGQIAAIMVKEGDIVQAGQVLASQENSALLEMAVQSAQQNLDVARKTLANLKVNAALNLANAQLALVTAQKAYDEALKHRKVKDYHRCTQETIDLYGQILSDAQDRLKQLQENNEGSNTTYLRKLTTAQSDVDVANANYLYCLNFTEQEVAESDAAINAADAALKVAAARLTLLQGGGGVDPDETARLQAAVTSAELALANAQSALSRAVLKSTISGSVVSLDAHPGQAVLAGQPILSVFSLDHLQVETTDLSERDIARVRVGQQASVQIEALGANLSGKVQRIAPRATKMGGDVVFKVIIQLDEQPVGLLWGMSVKVDLAAD